ncbi:neuraminidase, partial [Kibdelosporangium lantanae]
MQVAIVTGASSGIGQGAAVEIALASYPGFHVTAPPGNATPRFDQQVIFTGGQGYSCFRIPAVVRSTKGTLLAFAE